MMTMDPRLRAFFPKSHPRWMIPATWTWASMVHPRLLLVGCDHVGGDYGIVDFLNQGLLSSGCGYDQSSKVNRRLCHSF